MRPPPMTTRRWMIAVAVVAVLIGSGQSVARWHRYRKLAAYHGTQFTELSAELAPLLEYQRDVGRFPGSAIGQRPFEYECKKAEWHGRLKTKYEQAARYPWLPVAPDPPEPE